MKKLTKESMECIAGGRTPNWGDFASGLCVGLGVSLAIGGLFVPAVKVLSAVGTASGIACGLNDSLNIL